jgi:hypothetical protein
MLNKLIIDPHILAAIKRVHLLEPACSQIVILVVDYLPALWEVLAGGLGHQQLLEALYQHWVEEKQEG